MSEIQVNKEEQELLQKFRLLSPSSRKTVMTAVAEAVLVNGQNTETSTCSGIAQSAEGNEILVEETN